MFQNIKVDIIYYQTGTDFEMEFNLCGCCRMRLLTDKAEDPKGLVHLLARAVSRSRVIIACGALFGPDGLIATVSAAIGKPLAAADNKAFNIRDEREIMIIGGSMPLVTPDGIFGGCIIESGPQAIILLSESKSVRKTIMNTLIHPYVEDLSLTPVSGGGAHAAEPAEAPAPEVPPVLPVIPEPVDIPIPPVVPEAAEDSDLLPVPEEPASEEPMPEPAEEEPLSPQADEAAPTPAPPTDNQPEPEPEPIIVPEELPPAEEPRPTEPPAPPIGGGISFVLSNGDADEGDYELPPADPFPLHIDDDPTPAARRQKRLRLPILILAVLLLIGIGALAYLLVYLPMRDGVSLNEYLREIFSTAGRVGVHFPSLR